MKVFRPKAALLGVAVLGVLLAGCGPTDSTASPADASTTAPVQATTDAGPAIDPVVTTEPALTTTPPPTAAAKPAGTKKPAAKPTTRKPTTHKPAPKPTTQKPAPKPKPTTKAPTTFVHPGAFCAPAGKLGHTSKGTLMRCTLKAGEDQPRWRAA